jgi:hypothetical protein
LARCSIIMEIPRECSRREVQSWSFVIDIHFFDSFSRFVCFGLFLFLWGKGSGFISAEVDAHVNQREARRPDCSCAKAKYMRRLIENFCK